MEKILKEIKKYEWTDTAIVMQQEIYDIISKDFNINFTNRDIWIRYIYWLKLYYGDAKQTIMLTRLLSETKDVLIIWSNWYALMKRQQSL